MNEAQEGRFGARNTHEDMVVGVNQAAEAQTSAEKSAAMLAQLQERLRLVRGEIAAAEEQGKPAQEIANLKMIAETRAKQILELMDKNEPSN